MGVKATLATITPSTTHINAAQTLGRGGPAQLHGLVNSHVADMVAALNQLINDATKGNSGDSNIAQYQALITALT
jgi:hypothetical protein